MTRQRIKMMLIRMPIMMIKISLVPSKKLTDFLIQCEIAETFILLLSQYF